MGGNTKNYWAEVENSLRRSRVEQKQPVSRKGSQAVSIHSLKWTQQSHAIVKKVRLIIMLGCVNRTIRHTKQHSTLYPAPVSGRGLCPVLVATARRESTDQETARLNIRSSHRLSFFSLWSRGKTERAEREEGNSLCRDKLYRISAGKVEVCLFPLALHQGWALDAGRSRQLYLFSTILEQE